MTDRTLLEEQILSILEDEDIDTATNDAIMALIRQGLERRAEIERDIQPCTAEAVKRGCTCTMSVVRSTDIDPPVEVIDLDCPLHGIPLDPDTYYDAQRTGD